MPMSIEEIYRTSTERDFTLVELSGYAATLGMSLPELFNELSLLFARRFLAGEESYENADFAMNGLEARMIDFVMEYDEVFPEPAQAIYAARSEERRVGKE